MNTAIAWFEIPARDLNRAAEFYGTLVGKPLVRQAMGAMSMAIFPYERESGVGGCVVASETLKPGTSGSIVYLNVGTDLDSALARATHAGGKIALEKTALPDGMGHFAHIIDSEGNCVGLHAA